jgi:outer membrane protein assembly factor BamB
MKALFERSAKRSVSSVLSVLSAARSPLSVLSVLSVARSPLSVLSVLSVARSPLSVLSVLSVARSPLFVLSVACLVSVSSVVAQDWAQWRGPQRTGATAAFKAPATWPDRPKQVWKVKAGAGHASPIVAEGRVYLFARVGEREGATAFDLATGKQLWQQLYEAPYAMNSAATSHGKGPKSTPVYDRGRVYTFGISGILSAFQAADGRIAWKRDFTKDFPTTAPDFGVSMSPILAGNLLIVHVGGSGNGAILGVDTATGQTKWSWKGDGPGYASPVLAELGGTRQIITQSQRHVVSLAAADGRLLWQIPFTTEYEQNIITPVVVGDLVIYAGIGKPTTAIRVTPAGAASAPEAAARSRRSLGEGGGFQTAKVWENADIPMYMSSPVEIHGYLYGLTTRNRGQFFCVDARTGKTTWTTKGREAENAAFIAAGDLLLAVTTEGEVVVMRANPKQFDLVKRYTVADSPIWAHPAMVPNGLIVKDAETLAFWAF